MENENQVETPIVESETTENTTETETTTTPVVEKDFELEAKNKQLYERAKKAEAEAKVARQEIERLKKVSTGSKGLDVSDYIDISSSLEGLTQREKEKLAQEHKLTGKPIKELRNSEDFLLWQSALKQKMEREAASLPPSSKQPDDNSPISLDDALAGAQSMEEKEALLAETMGYSIGNKPRTDRVVIGR